MSDEKAQPAALAEKAAELEKKRLEARLKERLEAEQNEDLTATGYSFLKKSDLALLKTSIIIHPTVLLSISDHYSRAAQGTSRRVVGCLLGEKQSDGWHVTNTFGVPFEEDAKDSSVWYLDHSYLDKMYKMFKKINAKEQVVGWYSTASSIRSNDIEIHELVRKYSRHPLYLLADVLSPDSTKVPIQTYLSFEQPSNNEATRREFVHMNCAIGSTEAEEVGVEHLLRELQSANTSTLGTMINDKIRALKQMSQKLREISEYLALTADGKYPVKPHLLAQLQILLNSMPDKSSPKELSNAFQQNINDALLATYVAFATRMVMMVHDLVKNKVRLREKANKS